MVSTHPMPAQHFGCEFAPKKPNGPLSRRCMHCGEHECMHGAPGEIPASDSNPQQESGLAQMSPEHEELGAEMQPILGFRTLSDGITGSELVILDTECYLLRNFLGADQQADLLRYILDRDQDPRDRPKAMVSAPKTLQLGEEEPSIRFTPGQQSLVTEIIAKAIDMLDRNQIGCDGVTLADWGSISMAAIQYESPDGHFHPHIDHCDNSFVFLISLGCTANFMVKGPNMENRCHFKFLSGDLLVFNASTEAAILHGVMSIDDERSNPSSLRDTFHVLQNHRYGVQCRLYF